MQYKQYTQCIKTEDFSPLNRPLTVIGGIGGLLGLIAAIIASAVGGALLSSVGAAAWLAGSSAGYAAIIATFKYLLGGKLICLGGDKSACGTVVSREPASSKPFPDNLDNDYSFNLVLAPHAIDDQLKLNDLGFQDDLVVEQEQSRRHGIPFHGYEKYEGRPVLHNELEGSRIHDTYQAFLAAWSILVAAALLAMALGTIPVIGWLLAILVFLIGAAVAAGVVAVTWALADDGKVSDVDPTFGELHDGDILFVLGVWTYDSGHNDKNHGWNELHPIKYLQKLDAVLTEEQIREQEKKVREAETPEVRKKQQSLEQHWTVHPYLDGCQPVRGQEDPVLVIR